MRPSQSDSGSAARKSTSSKQTGSAGPADGRVMLETLRTRVRAAVDEIVRLRNENETLRRRLDDVRSQPRVDRDAIVLNVDQSPEELRRAIESYIELLDQYIGSQD